jgi:hypothetical protein
MRTATGIYRTLHAFLQTPEGVATDPHFKSGVLYGTGMTSLVLSLLPGRVMSVMELFGYKGDRTEVPQAFVLHLHALNRSSRRHSRR